MWSVEEHIGGVALGLRDHPIGALAFGRQTAPAGPNITAAWTLVRPFGACAWRRTLSQGDGGHTIVVGTTLMIWQDRERSQKDENGYDPGGHDLTQFAQAYRPARSRATTCG